MPVHADTVDNDANKGETALFGEAVF